MISPRVLAEAAESSRAAEVRSSRAVAAVLLSEAAAEAFSEDSLQRRLVVEALATLPVLVALLAALEPLR